MAAHFGHTGYGNVGSGNIAVCHSCGDVVFFPFSEMGKLDNCNSLTYLDKVVHCCNDPDYVYQLVHVITVPVVCPTCGQEIKGKN